MSNESCPLCHSNRLTKLVQRKDERWINRCAQCNHCFIPISEDTHWLKEIYASNYNCFSREESEIQREAEEWFRTPEGYFQIGLNWLKKSRSLKDARVLEIGCGFGHFLVALREEGAKIHGIDGNPSAALFAKKWFGLDVQVGQIEELVPHLHKRSFDVVIFFETIEHLIDPLKTLQQIHALLADRGLLLISTPNFSLFWAEKSGYGDLSQRFEHIHFFEPHTLSTILQKTGFKVVTHLSCGSDVPLIERLTIRTGFRSLITSWWPSIRKFSPLRIPLRLAYRWINSQTKSLGLDRHSKTGLLVAAEKL